MENCRENSLPKRKVMLSNIRIIIFSLTLMSAVAAWPILAEETSPIISPEISTNNKPEAIAAAKKLGKQSAQRDIKAGAFRILYYGKPWSTGKPLVDETTGYRVQIIAGCSVSEPFIAETAAYNQTMRDWHSKTTRGGPAEKRRQQSGRNVWP
jgi:hypothetical protein